MQDLEYRWRDWVRRLEKLPNTVGSLSITINEVTGAWRHLPSDLLAPQFRLPCLQSSLELGIWVKQCGGLQVRGESFLSKKERMPSTVPPETQWVGKGSVLFKL